MTVSLKIAFAGTPEFAVPSLEALVHAGHRVSAVYTQPDRPAGRGLKTGVSAIKAAALKHGLAIRQPTTLRSDAVLQILEDDAPELMIVVAYGLIIPESVLRVPRLGCVNVHASLLPRWRGAAPIQRAILAGDNMSGVTIMQMDAGLDTGPVLATAHCPIETDMNAAVLHDRLARLGASTLVNLLDQHPGTLPDPRPQDEQGACYAHKIDKAEARVDWGQSAAQIERQVRAFNPWPIAFTEFRGRSLRLWSASELDRRPQDGAPGTIVATSREGIDVACGEGHLRIKELQLAGKRRLTAPEFLNAQSVAGERLK